MASEVLFMVIVSIRYPTGATYDYESKVTANDRREAIRKLIRFEMITPTMIFYSKAIEAEGAV